MSVADHTTSVEYRDIHECPGYRFGSDGSIWSRWRSGGRLFDEWRRLEPCAGAKGYLSTVIKIAGRHRSVRVHKMILWAFNGPRPDGAHGCHWDGDKLNNAIDNLRWASPQENIRDALRHGTHAIGERHNHAKLTEPQVRAIRQRHRDGEKTADLAREHGLRYCTVMLLVKGKTWKHVV
jgi:hypothetical protein